MATAVDSPAASALPLTLARDFFAAFLVAFDATRLAVRVAIFFVAFLILRFAGLVAGPSRLVARFFFAAFFFRVVFFAVRFLATGHRCAIVAAGAGGVTVLASCPGGFAVNWPTSRNHAQSKDATVHGRVRGCHAARQHTSGVNSPVAAMASVMICQVMVSRFGVANFSWCQCLNNPRDGCRQRIQHNSKRHGPDNQPATADVHLECVR